MRVRDQDGEDKEMIKLKFWLWTVIIIWDHKRYHASKNPVKRKVIFENGTGPIQEVQSAGTITLTYPPAGE